MSRFLITQDIISKVKRLNLQGRKVEFKINPVPDGLDPVEWVKGAVEAIVHYATRNVEPSDKIGVTFCGESFKEHGPGWLPFTEASKLTMKDVWDLISKIFQSNSHALSTETFCLSVTTVRLPMGSGKHRKYNTFDEECVKRNGIVTINNRDNLCLARAIVVAMAAVSKDPDYQKVRKDTGKLQSRRAEELLIAADVTIPPEGAGK